ncbi:MAG TPA: (2Fe-2S)-binding protein [Caldisericia bacterium]|nr:(2Fe-2S)-binding protein [Caldisericia bacterium]HON84174.1 (2Fe-2S)-binding protein [Caldisericia bacterium]HRU73814.1 (2Fe-2S)-binding protein [Caldisericia bacterium]
MKKISFILNGEKRSVYVEPNDLLLDVLRDKLGVKSPKYGCGRGDCGTCTVLLNGKSVRSCLILAVEVDNQEIMTLEGISKDGLTGLQEYFLKHNSFQCGYCAPGMTLALEEFLKRNPKPNEEEVKEAISGNLCRCTGYVSIIRAVMDYVKNRGG